LSRTPGPHPDNVVVRGSAMDQATVTRHNAVRLGPDHRVMTTKVALSLPTDLPYEQWERTGRQLAGALSSSSWWLGDWLIYGREL
jgi:hypothetical protein